MKKIYFNQLFTGIEWFSQGVVIELSDTGDIVSLYESPPVEDAEVISGIGMPGMPNLHSHAHQRVMVGLTEWREGDNDFWSWRNLMYRVANQITPEQLEAVAAQLYMEMLQQGYTAVAEFQYLHHDSNGQPYQQRAEMSLRCMDAAAQVGIGITSLPVLYSYGDFDCVAAGDDQRRFINDLPQYMKLLEELQIASLQYANSQVGVAAHSLRAVSSKQLLELASVTQGLPKHIHIAEQTKEVSACIAHYGKRPVEWLASNIDLDSEWSLIHATQIEGHEIRELARSGAVVGLCPTTEANLGDGFFPALDFIGQGGVWGIGSDSHISINPTEELRWLEYGQRLQRHKRNVLGDEHTGTTLVQEALQGGARSCGRRIGKLQVGDRADLIVLDHEHPKLYGRHPSHILDSWVFAQSDNSIRHVMVGGEWEIRDGCHPRQKEITTRFKQTIDELSLDNI